MSKRDSTRVHSKMIGPGTRHCSVLRLCWIQITHPRAPEWSILVLCRGVGTLNKTKTDTISAFIGRLQIFVESLLIQGTRPPLDSDATDTAPIRILEVSKTFIITEVCMSRRLYELTLD